MDNCDKEGDARGPEASKKPQGPAVNSVVASPAAATSTQSQARDQVGVDAAKPNCDSNEVFPNEKRDTEMSTISNHLGRGQKLTLESIVAMDDNELTVSPFSTPSCSDEEDEVDGDSEDWETMDEDASDEHDCDV